VALNIVETIDDSVRVRTVLVSVSDKAGLESFIPRLLSANPELTILSTGGTHEHIARLLGAKAGRCLRQVSEYTGQPEMQGGLVKTLDFRIYLGILSETHNPSHAADLARCGAIPIDMVVVNLYPFGETIATPGATPEAARSNIDIGGPCMIRAAAKNFHRVAALCDPIDYQWIARELEERGGSLSLATRFRLAQKAFRLTAGYDATIAQYLGGVAFESARDCYDVKSGS
jgi:phosphoribosylaminoimidazolecarboxamide formyltransferase/IMP cyclohydrolase